MSRPQVAVVSFVVLMLVLIAVAASLLFLGPVSPSWVTQTPPTPTDSSPSMAEAPSAVSPMEAAVPASASPPDEPETLPEPAADLETKPAPEEPLVLGSVRGVVRTVAGEPLADVTVRLMRDTGSQAAPQVTTAADGRFEFADLTLQTYELQLRRDEFQQRSPEAFELTANQPHQTFALTLQRLPLEIVALDEDDQRVFGAYVASDVFGTPCGEFAFSSNGEGALRFEDLEPQRLAGRWLAARGYSSTPIPWESAHRHANVMRIEVRLGGGSAVRVIVERTDGESAEGLTVVLTAVEHSASYSHAVDGGFADFGGVAPGRYHVYAQLGLAESEVESEAHRVLFRVENPREIPFDRDRIVVEDGVPKEVRVRLHVVDVLGELLDEDSVPIIGARVHPTANPFFASTQPSMTGAQGEFRFTRPVGPDTFAMLIEWEGVRRPLRIESPPINAPMPYRVTIHWREPEAQTLQLAVVDYHSGDPIAGAHIFLSYLDEGRFYRGVGRSDANGRARLDNFPLGRHRFHVRHPDFFSLKDEEALIEDASILVKLERSGVVRWQLSGFETEPSNPRTTERVRVEWTNLARPGAKPQSRRLVVERDLVTQRFPANLRIGNHYRLEVQIAGYEPFTLEARAEHPDDAAIHQVTLRPR